MARTIGTRRDLSRIEGIEEVLKNIEKRLPKDRAVGQKLKEVFKHAAEPIQEQARSNIKSTPLNESGKKLLSEMVVVGKGPARHPNAFVSLYQFAIHSDTILNPYWVEFGTAMRFTGKKGGPRRFTGQIIFSPFFRPAISQARGKVKGRLVDGLRTVLVDAK